MGVRHDPLHRADKQRPASHMRCPRDHAPLLPRHAGSFAAFRCNDCFGAWLPNEVLRLASEAPVSMPPSVAASSPDEARDERQLSCPNGCGILRQRVGEVALHQCPTCLGGWLSFASITKALERRQSQRQTGLGTQIATSVALEGAFGVLYALLS